MDAVLNVGAHPEPGVGAFEIEDAITIVFGYCFARKPVRWNRETDSLVGGAVENLVRHRFAFDTYDLVPRGTTPRLEPVDVLVADGLNAGMGETAIAGALSVADLVSEQLLEIDEETVFWELPRDHIADMPPANTQAWHMWRASELLRGVHKVALAITNKILHHKRPTVFPLIDNMTFPYLQGDGKNDWLWVYDDLNAVPHAWQHLEDIVLQGCERSGINRDFAPKRLRLHDMLLWCKATNQLDDARSAGTEVRAVLELTP